MLGGMGVIDRSHNVQVGNLLLSVEQTQHQISCTHQNNPSTGTPWMSEIYCFARCDVDHIVRSELTGLSLCTGHLHAPCPKQ